MRQKSLKPLACTFFASGIRDTVAAFLFFFAYMSFVADFPSTFWFTGIIDGLFTILYVIFAFRGGLRMRNLFLPKTERIVKS